ncbi:hypothetical protein M409DRAFT_25929 [Zasmidium cellare ATCC 36951]|uniref:RING-type domain-containing protein n=1 Tax=Zasmidium cellare ATCC 36951 TaxID=1080233 RepID=A0A6A6C9P3_ZASCE|nr:uncharacterized protein M409DRAFT_25929 [Zasmidium cellare ATCC 36951]KAF2163745.1 hypothetical protein M409DRAFT_25929 [Zasmidium cellare ATCC 36951]
MTNQITATLPTREQFFTTGFISTPAPADISITECGICLEKFQTPVTLSCHPSHVFCLDCIAHWLREADACPLCKTKLFDTNPIPLRRRIIYQAHDILRQRGPAHNIENFGTGPYDGTAVDFDNVMWGNEIAVWWLDSGFFAPGRFNDRNGVQAIAGTGVINMVIHATPFAMLGNYIPAISEVQNRPYTAQQREHWTLVLTALRNILKQNEGRVMDTSPQAMLSKLRKVMKHLPDVSRIQFLRQVPHGLEDARLRADFMCLLDFVAVLAQIEKNRLVVENGGPLGQPGKWTAKLKSVKRLFTPIRRFGRWLVSDL